MVRKRNQFDSGIGLLFGGSASPLMKLEIEILDRKY
jgi:hypothetical protein